MNYDDVNLKDLGTIAEELSTLHAKIDMTELALADLKEKRDDLSRNKIPAIMQNAGLTEIKIPSGQKLTVEDKLRVSIPEDEAKQKAAFDFLIGNGFEEAIKTQAIIPDPNEWIIESLKELGLTFSKVSSVHHATLAAAFRDILGLKKGSVQRVSREEIPEYFSLYMYKETKLK